MKEETATTQPLNQWNLTSRAGSRTWKTQSLGEFGLSISGFTNPNLSLSNKKILLTTITLPNTFCFQCCHVFRALHTFTSSTSRRTHPEQGKQSIFHIFSMMLYASQSCQFWPSHISTHVSPPVLSFATSHTGICLGNFYESRQTATHCWSKLFPCIGEKTDKAAMLTNWVFTHHSPESLLPPLWGYWTQVGTQHRLKRNRDVWQIGTQDAGVNPDLKSHPVGSCIYTTEFSSPKQRNNFPFLWHLLFFIHTFVQAKWKART